MRISIEIDLDNDAFYPDPECEVAGILNRLVNDHRFAGAMATADNGGAEGFRIRDVNGNTVGRVDVSASDDERSERDS